MTSELQRKRGYAIPDPIDGYTDFVCYQIYVPDVQEYRLAFEAQVQGLDRWWMWDKDGDKIEKRAARAARYWYALTKELTASNCETDMFDIRQKPDAPCTIQKTFNAGGLWIDAVNMQLCPPRVRTNNGIIEWYNPSTDGWLPTEGGDERFDGSAPIPWPSPPVGENGACLAAENITAVYQTMLTEIRAGVVEGKAVTIVGSVITSIASLFIPAAIFATGALLLSAAAFTLGEVGLDIMLQEEHLDNFKCVVYLNAESDGSITASGFTAIRAGMAGWASGLELEFIEQYLDGYGSVGLQRQARAGGITTGDCDDCDPVDDPFIWYVPAAINSGGYWGANTTPPWYPAAPSNVNVLSGEGTFPSLGDMVGDNAATPARGTIPNYGQGTDLGTVVVACVPLSPETRPMEGALDVAFQTTSDGSVGLNGLIRLALLVEGVWYVNVQMGNSYSVADGVQHILFSLTDINTYEWSAISIYISGYQVTEIVGLTFVPPV